MVYLSRLTITCCILILKLSLLTFAQDKFNETVKFPDQTINEYKMYIAQENRLDSVVLLSTEFNEFVKEFRKDKEKVGGFQVVGDLTKYFDYVRTQDILVQLVRIDQKKEDSLVLSNLRFKMQVEMANFNVSYNDLRFVYNYPGLFSDK